MIPFASQRGGGQDLATHLMNEHDNEYMEFAYLRGSVAQDLHGAFAEWEAQASALTKCSNYLYSLSVNPDTEQPLSRDQYVDYIDRTEDKLGLSGQPRAIVFHIKGGREHCHVVWSRIDAENGKAVQMAFDRDKLMMVTREFARDHELTLPDGYYKNKDQQQGKQLSLYEKVQQDEAGLSKEQRTELVTELWRKSDSAKAFVSALEQHGYLLATGKRPFVLVDIYGHTNALPKLIDDRRVRTSDIRAFLGTEYGPENLPSVEKAKAMAAHHRKSIEAFEKSRVKSDKFDVLKARQEKRREELSKQLAAIKQAQQSEQKLFDDKHQRQRDLLRQKYDLQVAQINQKRERHRATGLAAFLGRVTGASVIVKTIQKYQDQKRYAAHQFEVREMQDDQLRQRAQLERRFEVQQADVARQLRGLAQVDKREHKALETAQTKQQRLQINARHDHMPSLRLELKPRGRLAAPHKAMNRHRSSMADKLAREAKSVTAQRKPVDLFKDFKRAAKERDDDDKTGGRGEGSFGGGASPSKANTGKDKPKGNRTDRDDHKNNRKNPKDRDDHDPGRGR